MKKRNVVILCKKMWLLLLYDTRYFIGMVILMVLPKVFSLSFSVWSPELWSMSKKKCQHIVIDKDGDKCVTRLSSFSFLPFNVFAAWICQNCQSFCCLHEVTAIRSQEETKPKINIRLG